MQSRTMKGVAVFLLLSMICYAAFGCSITFHGIDGKSGESFGLEDSRKWTLKEVAAKVLSIEMAQKEAQLPVGYVYVQLPGQAEPQKLWGSLRWADVTPEYAGLFFRAEGGSSAPFGTVQSDSSPRLTSVKTSHTYPGNKDVCLGGPCSIPGNGKFSNWIDIEANYVDQRDPAGKYWTVGLMSFMVSKEEVTPRNNAVRIWKRT